MFNWFLKRRGLNDDERKDYFKNATIGTIIAVIILAGIWFLFV